MNITVQHFVGVLQEQSQEWFIVLVQPVDITVVDGVSLKFLVLFGPFVNIYLFVTVIVEICW